MDHTRSNRKYQTGKEAVGPCLFEWNTRNRQLHACSNEFQCQFGYCPPFKLTWRFRLQNQLVFTLFFCLISKIQSTWLAGGNTIVLNFNQRFKMSTFPYRYKPTYYTKYTNIKPITIHILFIVLCLPYLNAPNQWCKLLHTYLSHYKYCANADTHTNIHHTTWPCTQTNYERL